MSRSWSLFRLYIVVIILIKMSALKKHSGGKPDDRYSKAVAALLEKPDRPVVEALLLGGFIFNEGDKIDSDGKTIQTRKEYLMKKFKKTRDEMYAQDATGLVSVNTSDYTTSSIGNMTHSSRKERRASSALPAVQELENKRPPIGRSVLAAMSENYQRLVLKPDEGATKQQVGRHEFGIQMLKLDDDATKQQVGRHEFEEFQNELKELKAEHEQERAQWHMDRKRGDEATLDLTLRLSEAEAQLRLMQKPRAVLFASGSRDIVDGSLARAMTREWLSQLRDNLTPRVHRLVLSGKSYTPEAAQVIAEFITHFCIATQISSLDMSDVIASQSKGDGFAVLHTLANAFVGASSLEHIILSDNAMGLQGMTVCEALFTIGRPLKSISLCNVGLCSEAMKQVVDWLVSRNFAPNLQLVHLHNNMSGDDGCKSFQHLLNHCSPEVLTDLRYSSTRVFSDGSRWIATSLLDFVKRANTNSAVSMKRLDISDNVFQETEVLENLAKALKAMPYLEYINIADCMIENEGLALISQALLDHHHIVHLDISGNSITSDGVSSNGSFVQLLNKISPTLQVLNMNGNDLSDDFMDTLKESFGNILQKDEENDDSGIDEMEIEDMSKLNQAFSQVRLHSL